ncbi:MAG: DMT family transporter [Patescibacteria group bacterium]
MFKKETALIFIAGAVIISGLANFLNKFGLEAVGKNAYQYTGLKNIAAALILSLVLLARPGIIAKLKAISKTDWLKLLSVGLIGGSVPFLLYFQGLSLTTAVSASFIHKTLFLWVGLLAWPLLKERATKWQLAAFAALIAGNLIFDGFKLIGFGYPELLILAAVLMWAVENVIAKIILKNIDSGILAWSRMFFGSIILVGYLFLTSNLSGMFSVSASQWGWVVLVGVLLAGYNLTWYGALKKMPATVAVSALVLASPLTALLSAVFITHSWTFAKTEGLMIIMLAAAVMLIAEKNKKYVNGAAAAA